jgi:hypothetical protein
LEVVEGESGQVLETVVGEHHVEDGHFIEGRHACHSIGLCKVDEAHLEIPRDKAGLINLECGKAWILAVLGGKTWAYHQVVEVSLLASWEHAVVVSHISDVVMASHFQYHLVLVLQEDLHVSGGVLSRQGLLCSSLVSCSRIYMVGDDELSGALAVLELLLKPSELVCSFVLLLLLVVEVVVIHGIHG